MFLITIGFSVSAFLLYMCHFSNEKGVFIPKQGMKNGTRLMFEFLLSLVCTFLYFYFCIGNIFVVMVKINQSDIDAKVVRYSCEYLTTVVRRSRIYVTTVVRHIRDFVSHSMRLQRENAFILVASLCFESAEK